MSFAQERLWLLDRLAPGQPVYNIPLALRLDGALAPAALRRAFEGVVRRHEVLRTVFAEEAGRPVQRIAPPAAFDLPLADLGALPEARREAEAARLAAAAARHRFDLGRGPLLHALLVRLGPEAHVLAAAMHHIVSDGWSLGILEREISALYAAAVAGGKADLPPLPVQYADFALWQRRFLSDDALADLLAHWRERLAGLEALDLPADRPRPAVQRVRGGVEAAVLSDRSLRQLRGLARDGRATLFMALLASWAALLSRSTGQEDLAVGTAVANRGRLEIEGLIGFFVNALPLRIDLAGEPHFAELLRRVRETALTAYAHEEVPFERVVEAVRPQRDLSRSPLFQVLLVVREHPLAGLRMPGLAAAPLAVHNGTSKFDLTLSLGVDGDRFTAEIEYDSDLFDRTTVRRMANHLAILIAAAAGDVRAPLADLPLLGAAEAWQMLGEWNATPPLPGCRRGLHQLFEEQARQTPGAVALTWEREDRSYRDLDTQADRLARRLRRAGAGPETLVAVLLPRRPELVVALLAVLKSGAAYLPLDPSYPAERLELLLADSGARVLVTDGSLAPPAFGGAVVRAEDEAGGEPAPPEAAWLGPEQLAYVIYTSGSTGRPKGVGIRHGGAVALVAWAATWYGREELTGVLASTSVTFDLSIFEIFVPLALGGRVILAEDALALPGLPAAGEVTLVNTVPSAAAELVRAGAFPASVRTVNLAGEVLSAELARDLFERAGIARLDNLYGPSEDTTYSTCANLEAGHQPTRRPPLANARSYVIDSAGTT
jgi:non-ribosomal peptide synthetase component F